MNPTILLAQILGPVLLISSISLLLNYKLLQEYTKMLIKNESLVYLTSVLRLLFGLLILSFHNVWDFGAAMVVTLVGVAAVLSGTYEMFFPHKAVMQLKHYVSKTSWMKTYLFLIALIGLLLIAYVFSFTIAL